MRRQRAKLRHEAKGEFMKGKKWLMAGALTLLAASFPSAQTPHVAPPPHATHPAPKEAVPELTRPKLVVLIVVDQMRGDYVDKFQGQWNGGLKRLMQEGAWFRDAAYSYAATETCVGHATIATGSLPSTHGIVANGWFDRETQKPVTCTADPRAKTDGTGKGRDSAWRLEVPTFADELKFQSGGKARAVTFSLKARAAIMMGGFSADDEIWLDHGGWVDSGTAPNAVLTGKATETHSIKADYGKTWNISLPKSAYLYDEKATGAVAPAGWELTFPHALRGKVAGDTPDDAFYEEWAASPFADTYLTRLAENAIDELELGKKEGTDFLAVSYSSVDYVGHAFGPRSWEIQDMLVRLDKDLADLLAHLDAKVGHGNYVVAFSADHGVAPVPEDMQKTGVDAGVLDVQEVEAKIEKALESSDYPKPAVARIANTDIYFAPGVYDRLNRDAAAMRAVLDAIRSVPGVAEVYRADELQDRPATQSAIRNAVAASYFPGRSGDLVFVAKPYWLASGSPAGKGRSYGTGHGTPYEYDQRVPIMLMGWGIHPGHYFRRITPADIAPTLAELCGVTLARPDGRVLSESLRSGVRYQTPPVETR